MKWGVIVFPGSNCDRDCAHVLSDVLEQDASLIWHGETSLGGVEAVILPGGFSYGDYLRTGAIAQLSPIMHAVKEFAREGGLVLGICNGFQILLEAGLLPGAMLPNVGLSFICEDVCVKVENAETPFTRHYESGQVMLRLPIAHAEGNYHTDPVTLGRPPSQCPDRVPVLPGRRHRDGTGQSQRLPGQYSRDSQCRPATCWA